MEEPFGALDARTRGLMQRELLRIWQRSPKTVIFVAHDVQDAVYLADRVAVTSARPGRVKTLVDTQFDKNDPDIFKNKVLLTGAYWFLDPKNHDEVAKIASKMTKAPPERFGWLFTNQDNYRDPNLLPDPDALQKNVDATRELGFVKNKIDIKKHADLSLVTEAAKRSGKVPTYHIWYHGPGNVARGAYLLEPCDAPPRHKKIALQIWLTAEK